MTYRLFTANRNYSSWSLRPWVLMKMLGIAFEDEVVSFASDDNFAAFRKFSPSGRVPCLVDGERAVWDSLGIALYLADRHGGVWPVDEPAKAWAQCAVAEMHGGFGGLRNECPMNVGVRVSPKPMGDGLKRDVARIAELFGEGLRRFGGPYLAGEKFTAADAFFAPVAYRIRTYDLDVGSDGRAWVERMVALPAMREWEEAALAEPWREQSHEAELAATGTITADFRREMP